MSLFAIEVLMTIGKTVVPLKFEYHATKKALKELSARGFIEPCDLPSGYLVSIEGQKYLRRLMAL